MRLSIVILLGIGALALSGCKDHKTGGQQAGGGMGGMPPASVAVETMAPVDVPLQQDYAGTTEGSREVEVRAQVSGILIKQAYVEGSAVREGQLLFQIDPKPYQAKVDQAKAQLLQAQAQAQAAGRQWARVSQLYASQAVSGKDRDDAQSAEEAARAGVALAQAQLNAAQLDLGYTQVKAPISGITGLKSVSEGALIGTSANDSLLTTISQLDPIYVNFSYTDAEFMRQKDLFTQCQITADENHKVDAVMKFSDGTVFPQKGLIDFTARTIDRATGTIQARASFANPDHAVLPGQFVRIALQGLVCKGVLMLPDAAIMQGPQGAFVYRLGDKNAATVAPVKVGITLNGKVMIEDGLKPGDVVVTEGVMKVVPNMPVQPQSAASPAAAATDKAPQKDAAP